MAANLVIFCHQFDLLTLLTFKKPLTISGMDIVQMRLVSIELNIHVSGPIAKFKKLLTHGP